MDTRTWLPCLNESASQPFSFCIFLWPAACRNVTPPPSPSACLLVYQKVTEWTLTSARPLVGLVNNAGVSIAYPVEFFPETEMHQLYEVNLYVNFYVALLGCSTPCSFADISVLLGSGQSIRRHSS